MAILSGTADGTNEVEVRVKRYSENTSFEEHVKLGDQEQPCATSCQRYIVPEYGARYYIEVTFKAGYVYTPADHSVKIGLFFPRIEQPVAYCLTPFLGHPSAFPGRLREDYMCNLTESKGLNINGLNARTARFVFEALSIGENTEPAINHSQG
jgi:hypothetical protein